MLRLVTNIPALKRYAPGEMSVMVERQWRAGSLFRSRFSLLRRALSADAVLLNNPGPSEMAVAILLKLLARGALDLYFYDVLLAPQEPGLRGWAKSTVRRAASRLTRRIFMVHLDFPTYARELGIPSERMQWIGFKCNNFERVEHVPQPSLDGDYVLACGQSYRDYPTFLAAMARVNLPGLVVLPPGSGLSVHGSWFGEGAVPPNVRVEQHRGDRTSWDRFLAKARLVVLPLRGDTIQPAGISVCLEAMALGKPIVISESPLTRGGMFGPPVACTVPSGDPQALARAIDRLWHERETRAELARAGSELAMRLGGEERMARDLAQAILEDTVARAPVQSDTRRADEPAPPGH